MAVVILIVLQMTFSYAWISCNNHPARISRRDRVHKRHDKIQYPSNHLMDKTSPSQQQSLEEPDNQFGRMAYWDESYRESLVDNSTYEWYCGWEDLAPFFIELVPLDPSPSVLVPGVGNDACIRDMFDAEYQNLTMFDYAPEGVECVKRMFGDERLQQVEDLRVADARDLPYDDACYDAVLEKGTLDRIYLSGGKDKDTARKHLGMAVDELARVIKPDGIVFCVTAACVDAVQQAFDDCNKRRECWEQIRDGSLYMTDDGFTSNNIDATMLVWRRIK